MGLDLIKVERVDPCRTVNPNVTRYTVTGITVEEQPRTVQFGTVNDLKASLCARAKQTERYIWIGWMERRFSTREIVSVKLDDSKFEHEEAS